MNAPFATRRHRFTTESYLLAASAGAFPPSQPVELIEGDIVDMTPAGSHHVAVVNQLTTLLAPVLGGGSVLSVQNPLRVGELSMPEPDVVLLRSRPERPRTEYPRVEDVLLVIEVADASLADDLGRKAQVYAAAGVPEYWVVDLVHERIIVHTDPAAGGYASVAVRTSRETVRWPAAQHGSWRVSDILCLGI